MSGTKFALSGYVERSAVPHRPPPVMHHPDMGKLVYTLGGPLSVPAKVDIDYVHVWQRP